MKNKEVLTRAEENILSLQRLINNPIESTQKYFDVIGFDHAAESLERAAMAVFGGCKEHPQRALLSQIAILDDIFISLSTLAAKADSHNKRIELLDRAFKAQNQSRQALATLLQSQKSDINLTQNNFYTKK